MKKYKFRDLVGNIFIIEAIDRWDAFKVAKKQIALEHFIINDIKIIRNGL